MQWETCGTSLRIPRPMKEGNEVLWCQSGGSPASMLEQVISLQPLQAPGGAATHLQPLQRSAATPEPVTCPERTCSPESPCPGRLLAGAATHGQEPAKEQLKSARAFYSSFSFILSPVIAPKLSLKGGKCQKSICILFRRLGSICQHHTLYN